MSRVWHYQEWPRRWPSLGDDAGRRTLVLPGPRGALVLALWNCRCDWCDLARQHERDDRMFEEFAAFLDEMEERGHARDRLIDELRSRPLTMIEEADRDHPEAMARARAEVAADALAARGGDLGGPRVSADENGCYGWPRECAHWDDLGCMEAEDV